MKQKYNIQNKPKKYRVGILDTADYTNDELYGGSTGFIKTILPFFNHFETIIIGQGINGTTPWKPVIIENEITFIPVADFKFPSKIPLRPLALLAYSRYRNKILSLNLDVLYVHSPEICLPFLFFNKKSPVIFHQHGFSNALHSSKYFYGEFKIFRKFFDFALQLIYKKASWIIAIDNEGLEQSKNHGAINKTSLLLNAINTTLFKPNYLDRDKMRSNHNLKEEDFVIINTGRIEKQKGLNRLLECIPYFRNIKLKYHIFIVGDGTHMKELKKIVDDYQANNEVTFLGRISHEKLPDYYNMADVFVLPSEREGVPMAILESLACGTPAVATPIGGIPNVVNDYKNGFLLKDLEIKTIANTIMEAKSLNLSREEVSESISELSAENIASYILKIINTIIN